MAANASERRSRVVEALGFWFVTLLICAVAGFGSYRFGREWIGDRLGGEVKPVLTAGDLAERVSSETLAPEDGENVPDEPPAEAMVEVQPVALTEGDEKALEGQTPRELPDRDEAEERASESAPEDQDEDEPDAPVAPPPSPEPAEDKPEESTPDGDVGETVETDTRYVVRAGSFTKRANADQLIQELRAKGYQPYATATTVDGNTYTRVNVATYTEREKAVELRRSLREEGYEAELSAE